MELKFHPEVARDIEKLDNGIKMMLKKQLLKLKENPGLGKPLGKRNAGDLSGCRKLIFASKKYRIVYEPREGYILVWAVDKRERMTCYRKAIRRKSP